MNLTPPKQYVQGFTEFYKLKFKLTPDVLIPRPETELIVDMALAKAREIGQTKTPTIIDIGTGSGCIAISIAKNLKKVGIVATDVSPKALEVAKKNAKLHQVNNKKIVFIQNDLLEKFTMPPDIIVANLPYIPTARLMHIDPMVRDFEPKLALDGGYDGFELYRKLFAQMKNNQLKPKLFIGEIDEEQSDIAKVEAKRYFPHAVIEIKKDLTKKDRFIIIKF